MINLIANLVIYQPTPKYNYNWGEPHASKLSGTYERHIRKNLHKNIRINNALANVYP